MGFTLPWAHHLLFLYTGISLYYAIIICMQALLGLPNLMMLYLHGNNIITISQVDKLVPLGRLKSLTLHGNPVEVFPGYRSYIVSTLPQLQTFDFSGITKNERTISVAWQIMNAQKSKAIKKLTVEFS